MVEYGSGRSFLEGRAGLSALVLRGGVGRVGVRESQTRGVPRVARRLWRRGHSTMRRCRVVLMRCNPVAVTVRQMFCFDVLLLSQDLTRLRMRQGNADRYSAGVYSRDRLYLASLLRKAGKHLS